MPSQLFIYDSLGDDVVTGTAGDDFLLANSNHGTANDTINAGDGDDFLLGDSNRTYLTGTSNSQASPFNLSSLDVVWTTDENPFFGDSSIPHTSLYVLADAGQTHYSSVSVGAAQTITIDIDFGTHQVGFDTDVIVEIYDSAGVMVASNDDVSTSSGGAGSVSNFDSLVTFTNTTGVAEVYTIRFREFPQLNGGVNDLGVFEGGETFVANISVTGHAVNSPTVMGNDILNGGNGDDTIAGQGGNDQLNGGAGHDTLLGGSGADTMVGGLGDDTYAVDNTYDAVTELALEGIDEVRSSVNFTLSANVENLVLTDTAVYGTGNDLNNLIIGNASNNVLRGGTGADTLRGGLGNDIYSVDDVGDIVTELDLAGTDRVNSSVSYVLGANVENLKLFGAALNGTGNELNNIITGNSNNNVLDGGAGADLLTGGGGNDTYSVDNLGDAVKEYGSEGTDLVISSVNFKLFPNVEGLVLVGTAIFGTGNDLNNTITGNAANNILSGGKGSDHVNGGAGDDRIFGGRGNDFLNGGTGGDRFTFDTGLSATTNVDQISDFSVVDDTIALDQTIFTALTTLGTLSAAAFRSGTAALDADDRIIYDSTTGRIFYDADGNGAGAQVLFAQVTAGLALTNADFLIVG